METSEAWSYCVSIGLTGSKESSQHRAAHMVSLHAHQGVHGLEDSGEETCEPRIQKLVQGWSHSRCHQVIVCKLPSISYSAVLKTLPDRVREQKYQALYKRTEVWEKKTQGHYLDVNCDSDPWKPPQCAARLGVTTVAQPESQPGSQQGCFSTGHCLTQQE